MRSPSLGLVPLASGTVEHDFAMLSKFQEFSAELLRLSLLGIAAIGWVAQQLLFGKNEEVHTALAQWPHVRAWVLAALLAFIVSAWAALWHRYVSADSLSWHLQAMRRFASEDEAKIQLAQQETRQRYRQFRASQWGLRIAILALATAAACLVAAVLTVL